MNTRIFLVGGLIGLLLAGCAEKQPTAATPQAVTPAAQPQEPAAPGLATADSSVPLDRYQPLTSDRVLYLAVALSTAPVIYDQLAMNESAEYMKTSDTFRRKELLDILRPQIDAKIAEAKLNGRYVYIDLPPGKISLGHYNLDKEAFPVNGLTTTNFRLSNMAQFQWLSLPEGQAREIEAALSKGIAYKINENESSLGAPGSFPTVSRVYVFAQGAGADGRGVTYQIVKMVLMDTEGKALTEKGS